MKVKHLTIAVTVLAAASAATWFAKRGGDTPPADPREGQLILEAGVLPKLAALHIHTPTGDVDLAAAAGANKWTVRNYHDLPADFSKIRTLIDNLEQAKIARFASAQADRIAKMGFDGTTIELRDADGKALRSFQLGRTTESGRFLKFDDETKAYVASLSAYIDATPKNWADTTLVAAKPEQVVGLEAGFPDGTTLKFKRENGTAPWTAEGLADGEKLKESEVTSLVSKLTGLRFTETADPAAEDVTVARANSRAFKLTLATGKTYDVVLGRKPAPPAPPPPPAPEPAADGTTPPAPPAPPAPQPGPVYVFVQSSDANDAFNDVMKRRGYQIYEWTFTSLPANRAAMIEAPPAPAPAERPADAPATPPAATPESPTPPAAN